MMKINDEDRKIVRRLVLLFKPYIKNIIVITVCMIFSAGISTLIPLISKNIVDEGLIRNDYSLLIKLVIIGFVLVIVDQGIGLLETRFRMFISLMLPYELSKKAFKHLIKLNIMYFNDTNYAEIMNNINMDVSNISRIADRSLFYIVTQVFKIVGGIVGLILIDWKLTLVVLAIIPVKYKVINILARKRQDMFTKYMEVYGDYSSWQGDVIAGVKEIKLMGIDRLKVGEFIKKQRAIIKIDTKMNILDKVNEVSETVMFEIVTGVLYIIGAYFILNARFTVGGLMAFITYCIYVTAPISAILNIGYNFSDVLPSAKRFFEFLDMEKEDDGIINLKRIDCKEIRGILKFENISFKYKDDRKVLSNINFEVNEGEKVAIIGCNGSGKTTLINLLLRLLKPEGGKIYLDGIDISQIKTREYRQLISVVSQNAYLFNATIKENIYPYSRNDLKVYISAKESNIDDFIQSLPEKYDTLVGVNGANLSGGQKQKIAMARAIAKDSKILVLDEATSNYDIESEYQMIDLVVNKLKEKTVLMITHKLQVLKEVDKIIFIEHGKIGDLGTHEELYQRNTVYRELISSLNDNMDYKACNS
ncbi:UNVERIFIED_CONTAM: ATP-binding cassette subfamily B protein [Acetivibrio alkalicellulosi]